MTEQYIKRKIKNLILDRDGTIIKEKHYLHNPDDVELLPNSVLALKKFQNRGVQFFVVTNQSGIGRGYFGIEDFYRVQTRLYELLENQGVKIKDTYFCPHAPKEFCFCRKPRPGMWLSIKEKYGLNNEETMVVGDKICDVLFGINSNLALTTLVLTGYGKQHREIYGDYFIDYVASDLLDLFLILEANGYL